MGTYATSANGEPVTVSVTGPDTLKDAADLQAIIEGEYNGTTSAESVAITDIVGTLQSGAPLSDSQWANFHRLRAKYADALTKFRAGADADTEGFVPLPPTGTGRVLVEALRVQPSLARMAEQFVKANSTSRPTAVVANPDLLVWRRDDRVT